jgi:hypothetical protein
MDQVPMKTALPEQGFSGMKKICPKRRSVVPHQNDACFIKDDLFSFDAFTSLPVSSQTI